MLWQVSDLPSAQLPQVLLTAQRLYGLLVQGAMTQIASDGREQVPTQGFKAAASKRSCNQLMFIVQEQDERKLQVRRFCRIPGTKVHAMVSTGEAHCNAQLRLFLYWVSGD